MTFRIAALYQFLPVPDPAALHSLLEKECSKRAIVGALIIAFEGINGTIAGKIVEMDEIVKIITSIFPQLEIKFSHSDVEPFPRLRIRVKAEIVTMGLPDINPLCTKPGIYVEPEKWNELIQDPEVLLLDTRNEYEIAIGSFRNAKNPHTETFKGTNFRPSTTLNFCRPCKLHFD